MFTPRYTITPSIATNLMAVQNASTVVEHLPLPSSVLRDLQKQSRETTVILSTRIEGNPLDERAMRRAIYAKSEGGHEQEVANLARAFEFIQECEERQLPITEDLIKKLHAIIRVIPQGRRPRTSEYRSEQNQVGKRGQDGYFLPPVPADVPRLMEELVAWVNGADSQGTPAPIVAGIFLYQFLTIHPYIDGNGRTGRMLATYILRRAGLGLKGLFVLESYYDRNLTGYYQNLQMGLHHNYYYGRNDADITPWLEFFIAGVNEVYRDAARIVEAKSREYTEPEPPLLRSLGPEQRLVFGLLALKYDYLTTTDLRNLLELSDRTVRERTRNWIKQGFLSPWDDRAKRIRSVTLGPGFIELARQVSAEPQRYRYLLR